MRTWPRTLDEAGTVLSSGPRGVDGGTPATLATPESPLAPPAGAPFELEPGATLRHYEVLRPLGRGGMGAVYLARDTKLGRLVAIKALRTQSALGAQRLLVEARATARCRHENIVVIHDVDEVGGVPYLVLEHLEGQTLRAWLTGAPQSARSAPPSAPRPMPPAQAVALMRPVVRALACAHAAGIVHRDLKPDNVFLTEAGVVKVLDFGIAKRLDGAPRLTTPSVGGDESAPGGELTQRGELLGTLPYMAPEQWRGEAVDARTDLWAVGVMLFRLVAGEHPLGPAPSTFELAQLGALGVPMPSVFGPRPDVGPLGDVIDRCLRKAPAERFGSADELLAALDALEPERPDLAGAAASPFVGLAALQETDAARFFGRDAEVGAALGRLRSMPLLAVAGPSGVGKSSFVRAGLFPALKRAHERTETFVVRPGRRPLTALADLLLQTAEGGDEAANGAAHGRVGGAGEADEVARQLQAHPGSFGAHLRARCRRRGGGRRLVLFVDQFEELYTLGAAAAERAAFVACLQGAADDASSPLRVVLGLRSDFLDRVAESSAFAAELTRGLTLLGPMGAGGLGEALVRPLEAAGYRFEDDALARSMLDELAGARNPLPLLQFAATLLWQQRDRERRVLTRQSYERLGGVVGALTSHADATLASLAPGDHALCRAIFLRLVTPERTRAVANVGELGDLRDGSGARLEQVLARLVDARLVQVGPDGGREGPSVELVHESLIERWATLRGWLDESAFDAHFVARLRSAAALWRQSGEAEGLLWRDRAADEARVWQARAPRAGEALGQLEGRYLRAVLALSSRTRRRRGAIIAALFASLCAIAALVSLLALRAGREAGRAQREASRAHGEAGRADAVAARARNAARLAAAREVQTSDPTLALALLREVEPSIVPPEWGEQAFLARHGAISRAVLDHPQPVRTAAFSPDGARVVTGADDGVVRVFWADGRGEPIVLRGHEDRIHTAAFSPDGARVVTASRDGTARVWPADGRGEPVVLRGHDGSVLTAAFSPDGAHVVTASRDGTARVWPADGRGEPLVLRGHRATVVGASFSPDGARVVTASADKTARVWRADGRGRPVVLRGHTRDLETATFSPDGARVVTASLDKTARVWPADGRGRPVVLRGHTDELETAAFSPDGAHVVTASFDKTARLWAVGAAADPPLVYRHDSMVFAAAFSPDGRRVVTSAGDGSVTLWGTDGTQALRVLRGHADVVKGTSFSPDGQQVVSAGFDCAARVWATDGPGEPFLLRGPSHHLTGVAFSPDGRTLAASSYDHNLWLWPADGSGRPRVLRGHDHWLHALAFAPDGAQIATAASDQTVRVWALRGASPPLVLRGHGTVVTSVAFSPDGGRIVSGAYDKTARVWPADGRGEPLVLRGHRAAVTGVAFSPDGARIATSSHDQTARVWSADGAGEPVVLRGHDDGLEAIAFSPDGLHVATASGDHTARVWSADGAGEPIILRGHGRQVDFVAFTPDGRQLVTASQDQTVRIWPADGRGEPLVLRGPRPIVWAAFDPGTRRIAAVGEEPGVRVWPDITPVLTPDDPVLWAATTHCPSVSRRIQLLHSTEDVARAELETCERRVREARPAAPNAP
jgi:WD40 repeat protein